MKQRFCPYCRTFRDDVDFKFVIHVKTGSKRGQCTPCQEMRKRPREELQKLAQEDADSRRQTQSLAAKVAIEKKRKGDE